MAFEFQLIQIGTELFECLVSLPTSELINTNLLQRWPQVFLTWMAFLAWFLGLVITQHKTRTSWANLSASIPSFICISSSWECWETWPEGPAASFRNSWEWASSSPCPWPWSSNRFPSPGLNQKIYKLSTWCHHLNRAAPYEFFRNILKIYDWLPNLLVQFAVLETIYYYPNNHLMCELKTCEGSWGVSDNGTLELRII